MAAIASTRIASAGGVLHKPQAHDAAAANGTDASSPFQQMLSGATTAAAPTGQSGQDTPQSGKQTTKDSKTDGKTSPSRPDAKSQNAAAAGSKSQVKASTTNDDVQDDAGENNSGSGPVGSPITNDPPNQKPVPDANQVLAAAGTLPIQAGATPSKTQDANDAGNPAAALLDSGSQSCAPLAHPPSAASNDAVEASSASTGLAAATGAPGTSAPGAPDTSAPGAAKVSSKDPTAAQLAANQTTAQDTGSQSPAPVSKKEHKSAKTKGQDKAGATDAQPVPSDPMAALIAAAAPITAPAPTNSNPGPNDAADDAVAAAAQAGQSKGAGKTSQAASSPPAGAKSPVPGDQASGDAAKSNAGAQASQPGTPGALQDSSTAPGTASQTSDNKTAAPATGKDDKQAASVPAQPQVPQPQLQAQPPAAAAAAIQPQQPQHADGAGAVTQNIQVSQPDSNANANTVSALAVAIAARSQSGNKQFDIRLDPPDLGRVEVRLSIDATGKAQASLSADQPRTLDLLKTDAPMLARALRDAGLNVSQNGLNFSLRGQDRRNGGSSFASRSGRASRTSLIATGAIGSVAGGAHYHGPADGRLDIRV